MSDKIPVGGAGNFDGYDRVIQVMADVSKRLPKGVRLKRERSKYLNFQIQMPDGRRLTKASGCPLTDVGIYQALDKAHKIRHMVDTLTSETELWEWYDREILGKSQLKNDAITYREIFAALEEKYWSRPNRNTGRKRSKAIANDVGTFQRYYVVVFKKFRDWDKQPKWEEMRSVLFSWEKGSKSFKDAYVVIRNMCQLCPNSDKLLGLLGDVDAKQTEFTERQSISLEEFLEWHDKVMTEADDNDRDDRQSWLWAASMCVVYGLRPGEIAAAANLTTPYKEKGVTIPALSDPANKDLLLVLNDSNYLGVTIKTGGRVCKPLMGDSRVIERLKIRIPLLPQVHVKEGSQGAVKQNAFSRKFRDKLIQWNCPVTQAYAFRHLANQLGEKYGVPQEIRARSMGHSVAVNDSVYKKRNNLQTTVDLLTNHCKQPLTIQAAIDKLDSLGVDIGDKSVMFVLRVVYQSDSW